MAVTDEQIRFEQGRQEHADTVIVLMRALEDADPTGTPFDESKRRKLWTQLVSDHSLGRAWLIVAGERPIGYVALTLGFSFEYGGRDAFLDEIYVDEEYRGQGVGRQAIAIAEAAAREMGVDAVHLVVSRANKRAMELYRRQGYLLYQRDLMTKRLTTERT